MLIPNFPEAVSSMKNRSAFSSISFAGTIVRSTL
jgi:hypothetical protein